MLFNKKKRNAKTNQDHVRRVALLGIKVGNILCKNPFRSSYNLNLF